MVLRYIRSCGPLICALGNLDQVPQTNMRSPRPNIQPAAQNISAPGPPLFEQRPQPTAPGSGKPEQLCTCCYCRHQTSSQADPEILGPKQNEEAQEAKAAARPEHGLEAVAIAFLCVVIYPLGAYYVANGRTMLASRQRWRCDQSHTEMAGHLEAQVMMKRCREVDDSAGPGAQGGGRWRGKRK